MHDEVERPEVGTGAGKLVQAVTRAVAQAEARETVADNGAGTLPPSTEVESQTGQDTRPVLDINIPVPDLEAQGPATIAEPRDPVASALGPSEISPSSPALCDPGNPVLEMPPQTELDQMQLITVDDIFNELGPNTQFPFPPPTLVQAPFSYVLPAGSAALRAGLAMVNPVTSSMPLYSTGRPFIDVMATGPSQPRVENVLMSSSSSGSSADLALQLYPRPPGPSEEAPGTGGSGVGNGDGDGNEESESGWEESSASTEEDADSPLKIYHLSKEDRRAIRKLLHLYPQTLANFTLQSCVGKVMLLGMMTFIGGLMDYHVEEFNLASYKAAVESIEDFALSGIDLSWVKARLDVAAVVREKGIEFAKMVAAEDALEKAKHNLMEAEIRLEEAQKAVEQSKAVVAQCDKALNDADARVNLVNDRLLRTALQPGDNLMDRMFSDDYSPDRLDCDR